MSTSDKIKQLNDIKNLLEKMDQMAINQQRMAQVILYSSEHVKSTIESLSGEISSGIEQINMHLGEISDYQEATKKLQEQVAQNTQVITMQNEIVERNTERIRRIKEWEAKRTWYGNAYTYYPPI